MRSDARLATRISAGLLFLIAAVALAKGPEVGKAAPAFEVKLTDGSQVNNVDLRGNVVIVNFWATWCAPCRAEMPALDAYYRRHRDEGLKMLAISMDDPEDANKVRDVMAAFSFPAAMARDANFRGYGRIWRIPLTFVIDRDGILRKDAWYGEAGIDLSSLEKIVTPLLAPR
ncbi:MAG: TlpA disulfide reductase family protein [Betaproteobacteria bacterium]